MNKINVINAKVFKGDELLAQYELNEVIDQKDMDAFKAGIKEQYANGIKQRIDVDLAYREIHA